MTLPQSKQSRLFSKVTHYLIGSPKMLLRLILMVKLLQFIGMLMKTVIL